MSGCIEAPAPGDGIEVVARPRLANGVAVDATHVYWTDGERGGATILRTPKGQQAGGPAEVLVSHPYDGGPPYVDATGVWSSTGLGLVHVDPQGGVSFVTLSGDPGFIPGRLTGDGTQLYSIDPFHHTVARIAHDGAVTLLASPSGGQPFALAVDAGAVYWLEAEAATHVIRAARPDLVPVDLGELPGWAVALAVAPAGDLLYVAFPDRVVRVRAIDGGDLQPVTRIATPQGLDAIAVAGDTLILHDAGCGGAPEQVLAVPVTGGEPVALASYPGCLDLSGLAVDEVAVYLASAAPSDAYFSGGGIFRVAR